MKTVIKFFIISVVLFSCIKQPGTISPINSVFSFSGSPGNCSFATVSGSYLPGIALSTSNTVSIQVNVAKLGAYDISTTIVNGYYFSKKGTFSVAGIQTIVLTAIGTPIASRTDIFTPAADGITGCTFSINVGPTTPAVYTFSGAPAACTVATVNGTYGINTALIASNTVSVQVNVTTTGSYTISTNTVGGMTFSKTGTFTGTGVQTVILNGAGTPNTAGANTLRVGTNGCTFVVNVAGPAVYTLSGAPGACTVATVNGTYGINTVLTASNTVTVQVNVTTIGSYTISTNTVGGMTFSKSGIFAALGIQTVTLSGAGTPTTAGNNTLTVGTGGCTFVVNVAGPAVYTFSGAPGACTVATVNGTYSVGSNLGAPNTVDVQLNVTTLGAYNISTTAGGMTFAKSGIFTILGIQMVTLNGSGVPTTAGANIFTLGAGGCTFTINVTVPTGFYSCKIDGVYKSFTMQAGADITDDFYVPPLPYLYCDGYTAGAPGYNDPQFQIFINRNNNSVITPGTYNVDGYLLPNGYRIEIDYTLQNPDFSTTIWNTASTLFPPPNPPFTIIVTSITATRVTGTFSGTLTNTLQGSTLFKVITEGVFDLPIIP
jgi:hypothetical protein